MHLVLICIWSLRKKNLMEQTLCIGIVTWELFSSKRKKEYVLELPYPDDLSENGSAGQKREYDKHTNDALDVGCLMLATMSSELQKQYENTGAHNMIVGIHGMFESQARTERYNISKALFVCRLAEGCPVSPHVIKMIG